MSTKVLVFESDPAFAGELRTELDALGCTTTVVDDGNVGLQNAASDKPDLILLSIELPRMNGFSVCNKLKKDPALKDVPLIIMSTESSEETFDQHKKLRTRAEDYVHKPLPFHELLARIQQFVPLGVQAPESESPILIEDEIEVGASDYLEEEAAAPAGEADEATRPGSVRPPPSDRPASRPDGSVEAEVDAFAESAFGRLTGRDAPAPNGAASPSSEIAVAAAPARGAMAPMLSRASVRPGAFGTFGVDPGEHERVKSELTASRDRTDAIERELADARREVEKLRIEAGDAGRLAREVDELRGKLTASAKTGGISSREFLDLREALNKKDKELLVFREQISRKDREIVESQDKTLGLERSRADLEERLLGLERELAEAKERNESLFGDKELAKKNNDELRARLDRAKSENEARERQLSELRARQADERAANEVRLASIRAELDQVLANERAEHARALDQAEQRRRADLEQLRHDRDTAVAELREAAERDRAAGEAAKTQHTEEVRRLGEERAAQVAALEGQQRQEREEARERAARAESELAGLREELRQLGEKKQADDAASRARIAELEQALADVENTRSSLDQRLGAATERVTVLEGELEAARRTLGDVQARLDGELSRGERSRAKWDADRQSLERAKDALAVALAQIEDAENRPQP